MKESYYNYYIEEKNIVVFYNSFTHAYLLVNKSLHDIFKQSKDLNQLKEKHQKFYMNLIENGFIIGDDYSEKNEYFNRLLKRRFSGESYHLIINPTMDCNLNCWYCYESHKENSIMESKIQSSIIKHLYSKYISNKFKILNLSIFGGEPFLRQKDVLIPLLSKIHKFCEEKSIDLQIDITTNGTLITENLLNNLKKTHIEFQITLDGNKDTHDKIRYYKKSKKSTYSQIIKNLTKIKKYLDDYSIILRINFDDYTFNNSMSILEDIKELDKQRLLISLHRIFQIEENEINYINVINFVQMAQEKGFIVRINSIETNNFVCYADNYNEAIINYDGNVYKCTSNEFSESNSEGKLTETGEIVWKIPKLTQRLYTFIPEICQDCKFLPSCEGICSQRIINNDMECIHTEGGLSIEDIILLNLNYRATTDKLLNAIHEN